MSTPNVADIYPLAPLQEGILFHTVLDPASGTYVVQLTCLVDGRLDVDAFRTAWQRVVDRHPALRTLFLWEKREKPVQVVRQEAEVPWELLDWSDASAAEQSQRLEAFLVSERQRGFDLTRAPLMRLALIRTGDETHQFVWSVHHLLIDGWSVGVVLQEVFALYNAICQGDPVNLPTYRPYREYIGWLQRQDMARAEAYWRQALAGLTAPTSLGLAGGGDQRPADSSAGASADAHDEVHVRLPEEATASLTRLARTHGLTINTLVQGAWALLLSRYSGEEDVIFGATVAGRPAELPDVESIVGVFINTLPVRLRIPTATRLIDWLQQVQAQQAELRQFEYTPLVQVQGWSQVPRSQPLFESLLLVENYPMPSGRAGQSDVQLQNVRTVERTNYPLTVMIVPGTQLWVRLIYDRHRYAATAIGQLARHLESILQAMATNPEQSVMDVALLSDAEAQQVLQHWNETRREVPACGLHQLVEATVMQQPDALAVVAAVSDGSATPSLTYGQLNGQANRLARYLQAQGVGAETPVGIYLDRTPEMVVAVLAVLKAGGTYLPLDPHYPHDRVAFMLRDAEAPVVISTSDLARSLQGAISARWVCLDTDGPEIAPCSETNLTAEGEGGPFAADRLAYIIYTSGSTGKPKGVEVSHRNAVNLMTAMAQEPGLTAKDVLLAVTSLSFDIAGLELFLPLITGARLVVASRDVTGDGEALAQQMAVHGVTAMQATPATWNLLLQTGWQGDPNLKVLCGGEAMTRDLATQLLARCGSLWNVYGPTETTIWSTCERVTPGTGPVSVGRPIANTQAYILDGGLHPVPPGIRGELYIGGAGVARGYRGRPDLTAERFIRDPWGEAPGARLYRTGDVASWLPDGRIALHGRADYQVKVRGFRIEPGEIEEALHHHPQIREAVVTVAPGPSSFLVGYVVAQEGRPDDEAMRQFLKRSLPDYMIPTLFVWLDALPRTPNGKVDRRALPVPQVGASSGKAFVSPRTPVEMVLARLWAQTLQVERVGIHDTFFDLGGHSLLAARLIAQVRQTFQTQLPVRVLFEATTVAQMAEVLIKNEPKPGQAMAVAALVEKLKDLSPEQRQRLLGEKRQERAAQSAAGNEVNGK
ncbi:MAG TPA: amino acid adenylation domain-containing protein [Symbiobacteriaceae bacterium]|nr:amino acid adenylation domain-containing protein [Symbiobacteriaceae bacterium]